MKYLFLLLCIAFFSCKSESNNIKRIQDHVESYLRSHIKDLKGYEFQEMTGLDTVTAKDYLDREMEVLTLALMNKDERIKKMDSVETEARKTLEKNPNDSTSLTLIDQIERSKNLLNKQQHQLDSLTAEIKPELSTTFKFISVNFAFNSNDAAGNKVHHKYFVKLDEDLNVTNATELNH
jgi:hypothetical protein